MAAQIVDELLVLLKLDTSEYKKSDKEINKNVETTEKKLKKIDEARTKRTKEGSRAVKEFAGQMKSLALTVGSVLGISGGAAGLVQAVVALTNFETGLSRAGVSTKLSNRELQAWGSTARRLGADAEAGRAALAGLAKEQQQFNRTGHGPTMQALQSMGINITPDSKIEDVLANAQQVYRAAPKGQKDSIESGLAASGVSDDLILMIKSEKNVREEFARSYAESATKNQAALDSVTNALEAAKNSALNIANALATALQPQIEKFAEWMSKGATEVSAFVDKVIAAGGGIEGFMKVLDRESPELAQRLRTTGEVFGFLSEAADVVVFGFRKLGAIIPKIVDWIDEKLGNLLGGPGKVKGAAIDFGEGVAKGWKMLVGEAQDSASRPGGGVTLTPEAKARLAAGEGGATAGSSAAAAPAGAAKVAPRSGYTSQDEVMRGLISRGYSVAEAAGIAANIKAESGFKLGATNSEGGGEGAHGLMQWRGSRKRAFERIYGKPPSQGTLDEQLDFIKSDPEERRQMQAALRDGGSAQALGAAVSARYERHGDTQKDAERGVLAAQYAREYGAQQAAAAPPINISGPVTIVANDPKELAGGIQRVGGATNYNSAVR